MRTDVLIEGKGLVTIAYSEKPLPQRGEITKLSAAQLVAMFGFAYSESLHGDKDELALWLNNPSEHEPLNMEYPLTLDKVKERLAAPLDHFVVCRMDEGVGCGLFTAKKIEAGTVLLIYAGVIGNASFAFEKADEKDSSYDYLWNDIEANNSDPSRIKVVSPRNIGGLARFMQHLPRDRETKEGQIKQAIASYCAASDCRISSGIDAEDCVYTTAQKYAPFELEGIEFDDEATRNLLQKANVNISRVVIDGVTVLVCWAPSDIEENTQLGYDYGDKYWSNERRPRYFYSDGTLVPLTKYHHNSNFLSAPYSDDPKVNYMCGVTEYKEKKYWQAVSTLSVALQGFTAKVGLNSAECGLCYSTLASVYHDMPRAGTEINPHALLASVVGTGINPKALTCCEIAITIFSVVQSNNRASNNTEQCRHDDENLTKILEKYKGYLKKMQGNPMVLYTKAVETIDAKKYLQAICQLERICETSMNDNKLVGFCYNTMASCFAALGDRDKTIFCCTQAIHFATQSAPDGDSVSQTLLSALQTDLAKLGDISLCQPK